MTQTMTKEQFTELLRPVAEASFSPLRPLASFAGFESMTRANGKPICSYRCN
jgi:hypothetical protein